MKRTPNELLRSRYEQARSVVLREEKRHLTQQEFLNVAVGNNPRTGKPYNSRTLRKWLGNERSASRAVDTANRGGGLIQQTIEDEKGNRYSVTIANPEGRSRLDLYTPKRRTDIRNAVKEHAEKRIATSTQPGGTPAPTYWRKIGRRPRLAGARAVRHAKDETILRVHKSGRKAA